jgi:hypothetical protein
MSIIKVLHNSSYTHPKFISNISLIQQIKEKQITNYTFLQAAVIIPKFFNYVLIL